MLIIFSHILAFSTLFLGAIWDLKTTEVPDMIGWTGVIGGFALHAGKSYITGSLDPLIWSLGAGLIFSFYGWLMYLVGMWGGADAFAMSILGFAAPYSLNGLTPIYSVNLFVNIMLVGFIYSILFAFYKAYQEKGVFSKTYNRILDEEKRISFEILLSALIAVVANLEGSNGFFYFVFLLGMIFLYRFLKILEEEAMRSKTSTSDLEQGDVVSLHGIDIEISRDKTLIGKLIARFRKKAEKFGLGIFSKPLRRWEEKLGYPEIVGLREEEIEELKQEGIEFVEVKTGSRFVPVFPLALLVTDLLGGGIYWLLILF